MEGQIVSKNVICPTPAARRNTDGFDMILKYIRIEVDALVSANSKSEFAFHYEMRVTT